MVWSQKEIQADVKCETSFIFSMLFILCCLAAIISVKHFTYGRQTAKKTHHDRWVKALVLQKFPLYVYI